MKGLRIEAMEFYEGPKGPCTAALLSYEGRRIGWAIDDGTGIKVPKDRALKVKEWRLVKIINIAIESCVIHKLGKKGTVVALQDGTFDIIPGKPTTTRAPAVPYHGNPLIMVEAAAAPG